MLLVRQATIISCRLYHVHTFEYCFCYLDVHNPWECCRNHSTSALTVSICSMMPTSRAIPHSNKVAGKLAWSRFVTNTGRKHYTGLPSFKMSCTKTTHAAWHEYVVSLESSHMLAPSFFPSKHPATCWCCRHVDLNDRMIHSSCGLSANLSQKCWEIPNSNR